LLRVENGKRGRHVRDFLQSAPLLSFLCLDLRKAFSINLYRALGAASERSGFRGSGANRIHHPYETPALVCVRVSRFGKCACRQTHERELFPPRSYRRRFRPHQKENRMNTLFARTLAIAALACAAALHAQVPQLINYQGRVVVGTTNFNGTGQFKFALVDGSNGATLWRNHGTGAGEPANAVSIAVTNGLYSVLLGDASLANMAALPASVFTNPDVRLRVWFDDGASGSQLLAPDQRIAAVGYAIMAGNVADGAITGAKIAPGAIGSAQLAPGAAAANLNATGQSGVPTGGLLLAATENANLVNAGYVLMGTVTTSDAWQQRGNGAPPTARRYHTAVWTGSELIVWGGINDSGILDDGGRYNPATNSWTALNTTGAPSARYFHTAVWTGSEMIIWGGFNGFSSGFNDGARYNPTLNSWAPMSTTGAPAGRVLHTAVWTGSEMIIWGGSDLNTGARYNPVSNSWTAVTTTGAPARRISHTGLWTGSRMIVWGGVNADGVLNTGALYSPAENKWTAVSTTGAPAARRDHTAVWTTRDMLVWGGYGDGGVLNDGARYNAALNSWTVVSASGAPAARNSHTAAWTGREMILWGGVRDFVYLNDGARYNDAANTWTTLSTIGAPAARTDHAPVWTGSEMILWGGFNGTSYFNDIFSYTPGRVLYLYQRP
jgi:N-acetylneuraminic acid mutarotase